jgi:RND family efflux transporter MFP subunit
MIYLNARKTGYLVIPILIAFLFGCNGGEGETEQKVEKVISVKAMLVSATSKELKKSYTGTLEGKKQAVISARIAEAVEEVMEDEGSRVNADDILIKLDRTGPTSQYVQISSIYQNAEKNFKKMEYLFSEGAVSESQYDGARTEYEVSLANYDAACKLIDIRTPIKGTVTSIGVSPGDYLRPGQIVATVAAIDKMRMKFGVSGSDIGFFNEGDEVRVVVKSASQLVAEGKVITAARSADPATRTFQVEIEIDNQINTLKPGMFALAEIVVEKFEEIIIAPRDAVVNRDNKNYVFVVSGDSVTAKEVSLGVEFDGFIEIKNGLNSGDTLVTVGQNYLEDGYKVNLIQLIDAEMEGIKP